MPIPEKCHFFFMMPPDEGKLRAVGHYEGLVPAAANAYIMNGKLLRKRAYFLVNPGIGAVIEAKVEEFRF